MSARASAYYPAGHGQREDAVVMSLAPVTMQPWSLRLDERQRAMLREMGVRLWQPPPPVAAPLRDAAIDSVAADARPRKG